MDHRQRVGGRMGAAAERGGERSTLVGADVVRMEARTPGSEKALRREGSSLPNAHGRARNGSGGGQRSLEQAPLHRSRASGRMGTD